MTTTDNDTLDAIINGYEPDWQDVRDMAFEIQGLRAESAVKGEFLQAATVDSARLVKARAELEAERERLFKSDAAVLKYAAQRDEAQEALAEAMVEARSWQDEHASVAEDLHRLFSAACEATRMGSPRDVNELCEHLAATRGKLDAAEAHIADMAHTLREADANTRSAVDSMVKARVRAEALAARVAELEARIEAALGAAGTDTIHDILEGEVTNNDTVKTDRDEVLEGVLEICDRHAEGRCGSSEADGAANCAEDIRKRFGVAPKCARPCERQDARRRCTNACRHTDAGHDGDHVCHHHHDQESA